MIPSTIPIQFWKSGYRKRLSFRFDFCSTRKVILEALESKIGFHYEQASTEGISPGEPSASEPSYIQATKDSIYLTDILSTLSLSSSGQVELSKYT